MTSPNPILKFTPQTIVTNQKNETVFGYTFKHQYHYVMYEYKPHLVTDEEDRKKIDDILLFLKFTCNGMGYGLFNADNLLTAISKKMKELGPKFEGDVQVEVINDVTGIVDTIVVGVRKNPNV